MDLGNIITTIAEIAIALIGFSAIVVVLNPKPIRDWSVSERFNFRVLVQVGAIVALFSILPFGTNLVFDEYLAWKYALLTYGIFHVVDLTTFVIKFPKDVTSVNRAMPYFGYVIILIQLSVSFFGSIDAVKATYLASLVFHLVVSFIAFVVLVYGIHGRRDA
jgi:hypothetical protein